MWRLKMSIEWDSLISGGGNEVNTVGPATKNARRANSVRTCGTNSRGAPVSRNGIAPCQDPLPCEMDSPGSEVRNV